MQLIFNVKVIREKTQKTQLIILTTENQIKELLKALLHIEFLHLQIPWYMKAQWNKFLQSMEHIDSFHSDW